jgi:acylphosphatase
MKLRIVIKGPKVHDVGYRYFLMTKARSARIRRFDAENLDGAVEILVEGDESKVAAFKKLVETSHPERAEILDISSEDYDGEVMPISEYSQFCTNIQLNKAIPVLLNIVERIDKMNDNLGGKMDQMLVRQDETTEAVNNLKVDDVRLARIESDIKDIKTKIGAR